MLWMAYSGEKYYMSDHREYLACQSVQKEVKKQIRMAKRKLERSLTKKAKKDMKSKTSNRVNVGPLMGVEGLVTKDKEMTGILNVQNTEVFTSKDTTTLPEPERLFTGDDALSEMRGLRGTLPTTVPCPSPAWWAR